MMLNRISIATSLTACLALAAGLSGCRVHVDKDANGADKKLQIDTPFGGVHVNTNQTTAADLGLPVYPGAKLVDSDDNHNSADVHVGFGEWQMHLRVVSYATSDSKDKVSDFYKKAMGRYGNVIVCQGINAVGQPATTSEGLTCDDDKNTNVQIDRNDYGMSKGGLELKAGSKRHQHIVGFENAQDGQTKFALISLDLPSDTEEKSGKSD